MKVTFELKPGFTKEPTKQKWAPGALQPKETEFRLEAGH